MTTAQMRQKIRIATQRDAEENLRNIRHLFHSLAKRGKVPKYYDPMTPEGAAWAIVGAALCPSSAEKALEWVDEKNAFWQNMEQRGEKSILGLFTRILSDPHLAAAVDRAMIEKLTGVGMVGIWYTDDDGRDKVKTIRTASVTDVQVDYENYHMKDVVMIEGRFLQEIAEELAAVAEAAEIQKN